MNAARWVWSPDSRESGGVESEPAPSLPLGPEWAGGREVESLLHLSPEEAQSRLQWEAMELGRERAQQSRVAAGISSLMYRDVQVSGCAVCVHLRRRCSVRLWETHIMFRSDT